MAFNKQLSARFIRELILFLVLSFLQTLWMCPRCGTSRDFVSVYAFTFIMWLVLWKGNEGLGDLISMRISWIATPVRRFFIGLIGTIVFTVSSMALIMYLFETLAGFDFGPRSVNIIYGSVIVTFIISLFLHGREFLLFWRQATLDKEKFEKESIAARYESLKSQVNPHFLFNSLNALTNLVYEDQDNAVKFIKQLSDVYRYVLDTRDREVVPIGDELSFLTSYLYLQQIRFGPKLRIENRIQDHAFSITPLALQMLIENAIKHNVVSEDEPLTIKLYQENNYVVVENNLQVKRTSLEPSAGVGLENISKRYALLSDRKVIIERGEDFFRVSLPMLKIDKS
jgi:hypothetical protein